MGSIKTQAEVIQQIPTDTSQLCADILKIGKVELLKSYRQTRHLYNYMLTRSNQITSLTQLQLDKIYNNFLEDDFASLQSVTTTYRAQSEDFDNNMALSSQILRQSLQISYKYVKENADLAKWFTYLDSYKQNLYDMYATLDTLIDLFNSN